MAPVCVIQNIMILGIQYVLHVIIHANNALVFHLHHVQVVIQQNIAYLMEMEDANA